MKTHERAKDVRILNRHETIIYNEWKNSGLLQKIIEAVGDKKVEIFVDTGANTGVVTSLITELFNPSKVFCFEPLKENLERLKNNIKSKNFDVEFHFLQKGVFYGKKKSTAFSIGDGNTGGLFLEEVAREHASVYKNRLQSDEVTFDLTTYEDELPLTKVDIMKIDVEGSEWNIIENSQLLKNNVETLILEYHWKTREAALSFISKNLPKFEIYDIINTNIILRRKNEKS